MVETTTHSEATSAQPEQESIAAQITQMMTGQSPEQTDVTSNDQSRNIELDATQVTTETGSEDEPIITAELISKYPTLSGFKDKPLSEVLRAQDNLTRKMEKERGARVKAERALTEERIRNEESQKLLEQSRQKTTSESAIEQDDFGDPIADPRAYAQRIRDSVRKEVEKELFPLRQAYESQRQVQKVQADAIRAEQMILKVIPDNEVANVYSEFTTSLTNSIQDSPSYYVGKPDELASDVIAFYHNKQLQSLKNEISDLKKNGVKKIAGELKNAKTTTSQGVVRTGESQPATIAEQIVASRTRRSAATK